MNISIAISCCEIVCDCSNELLTIVCGGVRARVSVMQAHSSFSGPSAGGRGGGVGAIGLS